MTDHANPNIPAHGGSAAAAARLALLALRGSVHATMRLLPDAYALATAPDVVMRAEAMVPAFVAMPKPLRCRATASHGVVKVHLTAWRERRVAPAWDALGRHAAERTPAELQVLCGARDEVYQCSLADVALWSRDYQLVTGSYAFDDAENELAALWPLYREARARGIPYVLRLGNVPIAA
jgi:hypothetical protein